MRRIARDDSGAVAVIVAILAVVLFGMAALVIDVGRLYEERRELQNGADAAALAIANECADTGSWPANSEDIAATYADENSLDGVSEVVSVTFASAGGISYVQVIVATERADGGSVMAPLFSAVLGDTGTRVSAAATSICRPGGFAPIAFSICELNTILGDLPSIPGGPVTIEFQTGRHTECTGPGGQDKDGKEGSGAFGWLNSDDCRVSLPSGTDLGQVWLAGETGSFNPKIRVGCSEEDLLGDVYLMVFSEIEDKKKNDLPFYDCDGKGNTRCYHLSGVVKMNVTGAEFPSFKAGDCLGASSPSSDCIEGTVLDILTLVEAERETKVARLVANSDFPG